MDTELDQHKTFSHSVGILGSERRKRITTKISIEIMVLTFESFPDLIAFLQEKKSSEEGRAEIIAACRPSENHPPAKYVLDELDSYDLASLYANDNWRPEVPGLTHKLGGHQKELGHIHIDLICVSNTGKVEIDKIFMCR